MSFLSSLGSAINEQYGFGENSVTSLDTIDDKGRVKPFGLLGDFAKKFDQSAQRSYVEDGFIRNVRPNLRDIVWQQPDICILIKKRMFSSLSENYNLEKLEENEKLFIRASKKLFQNKCRVISAYERLTKIESLAIESGHMNSYMFPTLMNGVAELENAGILHNIMDTKTRSIFETLRRVHAFSEPNSTTTWLIDNETAFMSALGEGTGVIELTTVTQVNSKCGVTFNSGSANFTIEDPYKMFVITGDDIDVAIRDATNYFKNSAFGRFTEIETKKLIEQQKQQLNQQRAARGASTITIVLSPVTIVSKKIKAILDGGLVGDEGLGDRPTPEINFTFNSGLAGFGSDVDIDPVALRGKNGLSTKDVSVFKELIRNTYQLLAFQNETRSNVVQFNKDTNYARRKMLQHFNGRPLIQPMDTVNIFMTSRTMHDTNATQGFELQSRGLSFANKLNSLVKNINTLATSGARGADGLSIPSVDDMERTLIAGADFPPWLWRLYKNDFTKQAAGTSTFVGLVKNAVHNYSSGEAKYTLAVSCEDNAGYFTKSQINTVPALDVFNQRLYDPLTPFKVSFDGSSGEVLTDVQQGNIPELLSENVAILQSDATKFVNGQFRGQKANQDLYVAPNGEIDSSGNFERVLHDPPGFVYRWKEGIGTVTKTERAYPDSSVDDTSVTLLTANPFAGQDVMNTLSLLVTGQPYNYNTFLQAAMANGNALATTDEQKNSNVAKTYIAHITQQLTKRNAIWGNFVPFKKLTISEQAETFIRSGQADFSKQNSDLADLINQRAGLQDRLLLHDSAAPQTVARDASGQTKAVNPNGTSTEIEGLRTQIHLLDQQIDAAKREFEKTINKLAPSNSGRIIIIGDDISLSPSVSSSSSQTEEQRLEDSEEFKLKLNVITQRRLWKVKSNEDANLFIVDDQYDKNFDIMAFERKLGGKQELLKSEYTTIDKQIISTAELLGLEIFADTQGHIQARPPQYNRMPSSVFYRMFRAKERSGFQVFPQFLESLLFNQFQSIVSRIEIVEDEIRIRALALGVVSAGDIDPNKSIGVFLRGSSGNSAGATFSFVSSFDTGKIGDQSFQKFITQSDPESANYVNSGGLTNDVLGINNAVKATILFDPVARIGAIGAATQALSTQISAVNDTFLITKISERLTRNKGGPQITIRELQSDTRLSNNRANSTGITKIINEISAFVSERQKLLLSATNLIKNLTEGIQLNDQKKGATSALFPSLNKKGSIPGILKHMIEHEDNDDFGPGSGDRFVIRERQILNLKIQEEPPAHTIVGVNGLFGDGFVSTSQALGLSADGGNVVTSAYAVDYDMWRQYGFKAPRSVSAPYFSDPDTQCAPYAVYLLNLARKDILQGSVDVIGNEYYQPGDVIYLESYDLLFYVTDVSHSFAYSGNFTTSLTLRYGHTPGEYIPTQLDIIGKFLYKTKEYTNYFRSNREDAGGDNHISVVTFSNGRTGTILEQLLSGNMGQQNIKAMSQMLVATTGIVDPINFVDKKPIIQLRIYADLNSNLKAAAEEVKNWLQNPQKLTANQTVIAIHKENEGVDINTVNVEIKIIDVKAPNAPSPSAAAWHMVRTLMEQNSDINVFSSATQKIANIAQQQDQVLYNNIIDAWLVFEDIKPSISTGAQPTNSEAAQTDNKALSIAQTDALNKSELSAAEVNATLGPSTF